MFIGIAILVMLASYFLLTRKVGGQQNTSPYEWIEDFMKAKINEHFKSDLCTKVVVGQVGGFIFDDCMELDNRGVTYFAVAHIDSNLTQDEFSVLMDGITTMDALQASGAIIGAINKQLRS